MRPGWGTARLRWLKFPLDIFLPERSRRRAASSSRDKRVRVRRRPGSQVTGSGGGAGRLWLGLRRGRLRPVEPLSGLPATPRRVAGPAGDPAGAATPRRPAAAPAGQGDVGTGAVSPGTEGPPGRGAGRGGEAHARPAPTGANTSRASSPRRAPERGAAALGTWGRAATRGAGDPSRPDRDPTISGLEKLGLRGRGGG